jgi:hypothetical protein
VSENFTKRTLPRRIIALAAAYAIALSSLIASFGAAQASAAATAIPGGILCHTVDTGQSSPSPDETNGKLCVDSCCIGCLMMTAALPTPPANAAPLPQSVSHRVAPLEIAALGGRREAKSHRSRAPPLVA